MSPIGRADLSPETPEQGPQAALLRGPWACLTRWRSVTSEPTTVLGWVLAANGTLVTQELSPKEEPGREGEWLLIM